MSKGAWLCKAGVLQTPTLFRLISPNPNPTCPLYVSIGLARSGMTLTSAIFEPWTVFLNNLID